MFSIIVRLIRRYSHVNWALADQSMVSGVNFFTNILFARYLGLEEFGRFTLAWMAVLFVNSIQYAMITSPMMSIGPKQPEADAPAYYGAVLVQQTAFAGLSFVLLFVGVKASIIFFPQWQVGHLALPLASVALVFQMQDFMRRYFFTRNRASAAFVNDAVRYLSQLGILIWFFQIMKLDSSVVLWVIAGTSTMAVILGVLSLDRIVWNRGVFDTVTNSHWHFAKWMTGSAVMQWTSGNFFIMTAGGILGGAAVGAIKAAQNIMGVANILFQGLENVVPVKAAWHFNKGGRQQMVIYLRKVALVGSMVVGAIAMLVAIFPEYWLLLIYGDEYRGYGFLLQWFSVIYVLMYFGLPVRAALRAINQTFPIMLAYVLMSVWSVCLAVPLIKLFNLTGVMMGLLGTQLLFQAVLFYYFWTRVEKRKFSVH